MRFTEVTCAVIVRDGLILATRRGKDMDHAGLWEFPGGKLHPGESYEECLIREIKEELNVTVRITGELIPSEFQYPQKRIKLIPFWAEIVEGTLYSVEHDRVEWFSPSQLMRLAWPGADMPIVEQVIAHFIR
ncbi:MAG: (deoxy)nucleoside triphosphate pyrophosphohydrolase [Breznakibacter sp.]|nr:(deoxy)nucleoside triphosphate pyrophosphohydrolase [Chitinophagales bacterium]